ncbi:hypothetical protein THOM_3084, partial [Trachipleistophora hominis]
VEVEEVSGHQQPEEVEEDPEEDQVRDLAPVQALALVQVLEHQRAEAPFVR